MRKRIALVVALAATIVVSVAGAAETTTYWFGDATSNDWKVSSSHAVRYHHEVLNFDACLPSYAQFQVLNIATDGSHINTHRSAPGACQFEYPLTSNGQQAKAACRIISSGGPVTRSMNCKSTWD